MAEKKKIPEIRFKGFSEEWKYLNLSFLCLIGDIDHKMPKSVTEGIPYIMTGDFVGINNIDFENSKLISMQDYEQLSKKIKPEVGDILFARYASVGAVRYVETQMKFLVSYSCAILKHNDLANGKYLFYCFQSTKVQRQIELEINTGSQRNIGIDSLKRLIIYLPQHKEQESIATYFKHLDHLITFHQSKYDKLVNIKKAMLEKLFPKKDDDVPEIRFKGFSGAWKERKLGEVGNTYTGLSGKSKDDFGHGKGKFVTYMNVFSNTIAKPDLTESVEVDGNQNEVKLGDVFFTTSSETPEEVGMSSVWLENIENVYLNSFCFGYRPIENFDNNYLAYMLRSSAVRKKIIFLAQGISRYNISKNKVMEISAPKPSIVEQSKIGTFFKNLDHLLTLQQLELEKLKNIKKACLEKMFV